MVSDYDNLENPLLSDTSQDTVHNVVNVLKLLRRMETEDAEGEKFSREELFGLSDILAVAIHALENAWKSNAVNREMDKGYPGLKYTIDDLNADVVGINKNNLGKKGSYLFALEIDGKKWNIIEEFHPLGKGNSYRSVDLRYSREDAKKIAVEFARTYERETDTVTKCVILNLNDPTDCTLMKFEAQT